MNKAYISSNEYSTEGGCNACGVVHYKTYQLTIPHKTPQFLDDLDVISLVSAVLLASGWKQDFAIADAFDDSTTYTDGTTSVKLVEDFNALTYTSPDSELFVHNKYDDNEQLFSRVNEVLTDIFHFETFSFELE